MASKAFFVLETAEDTNWLKPDDLLLESISSDATTRTPLDNLGLTDFKERREVPLPEDCDSFKLMIQSDYYVHFDNNHNETCVDGYLQIPVKAGDSIRMIDFTNRTELCPNIPTITIRVHQCTPRGTYSMNEIFPNWLRQLYVKDGKYEIRDFEIVGEMPILWRDSRVNSIEVTTRIVPQRPLWLALRKDQAVVLHHENSVPYPDEAKEAVKKASFRPHQFVFPIESYDTIEIRPIPNWDEEQMEVALHEVLLTAPRPITKEQVWEETAKKLAHGIPNDKDTIFKRLETSCQENGGDTWFDTPMGKPLMKGTHSLAMEKVFQKPYTAHIFFRALEHNPGGNSHYNTVRYSWEVKEDKSIDCTGFDYQTFDGSQSFTGPWKPTTTDDPMTTVQNLESLIKDVAVSPVSTFSTRQATAQMMSSLNGVLLRLWCTRRVGGTS